MTKELWIETMQSVRKPLENNISRDLKSRQYLTTLPGVPDGEYVVIQFDTSFEWKKSVIENITLMLDKDGQW